jgi:hypothetical protein
LGPIFFVGKKIWPQNKKTGESEAKVGNPWEVKLKPAAAFPGYIHAMSVPMLHLVIHSDPSYDEPEPKKSLVVVVVITGFD